MTKELKCPKCGSTNIEVYDCFDTVRGEDTYTECYVGNCKDCNTDLQWDMVFSLRFIGYDEIEES